MHFTGLRSNECRELTRKKIDLYGGALSIMTKNGKHQSLPMTLLMREILDRRCAGLQPYDQQFKGVSAEGVTAWPGDEVACRRGAG